MRGLALAGGSARGAFQVGALDYLIKEKALTFDVVSGVSVGALNGAMEAMGKHERLKEIWKNIDGIGDVLKRSWLPYRGIYKPGPLFALIQKEVRSDDFLMPFHPGFCSYTDGRFYAPNVMKESESLTEKHILASAMMPGYMWPVEAKVPGTSPSTEHTLLDGGVRSITPIWTLLEEYPDLDEIYVIVNTQLHRIHKAAFNKTYWIWDILLRTVELFEEEIFLGDLLLAQAALKDRRYKVKRDPVGKWARLLRNREKVPKVHLIYSTNDPGDPMDFSQKSIQVRWNHGWNRAMDPVDLLDADIDPEN
jgi:NTE family protein